MTECSLNKGWCEAIVNSITDAVVLVDIQRHIVMINPAFTKMSGYTSEEVIGRTSEFLYASPEDFKEQWYDYIDLEFKRREEGFWY